MLPHLAQVISPASRLLEERPTRRSGWLNTDLMRAVSSAVMIASQFPGPRIAWSRRFHVVVVFDGGSYARCSEMRAEQRIEPPGDLPHRLTREESVGHLADDGCFFGDEDAADAVPVLRGAMPVPALPLDPCLRAGTIFGDAQVHHDLFHTVPCTRLERRRRGVGGAILLSGLGPVVLRGPLGSIRGVSP